MRRHTIYILRVNDMKIIGYKTEDGFEFYFNDNGELTDGDLVWSSAEELLSTIEADPIYEE